MTITVTTDVDVELDDIEDAELVAELESRGYEVSKSRFCTEGLTDRLHSLYIQYAMGKNVDQQLHELFEYALGKSV